MKFPFRMIKAEERGYSPFVSPGHEAATGMTL
jgi:hypothetical protein